VRKHGAFCSFLKSSPEERTVALVEIAQRFPRRGGRGLGVFRWVVERTLAWLHHFRRLALRYERHADVHEAFLTLGSVLITWRYLKREF
jgi:transposase